MTPFNWFNRQFNEQPQPEETAESQPVEETAEEKSEETTAPTEPAVNQDYLSWAKAAYANIQKQQAESVAEADAEADAEAAPEPESVDAVEAATAEAAEIPTEEIPTEEIPTEEIPAEEISEPIAEEVEPAEAIAEEPATVEESIESESAIAEPAEPTAPLPFWAQAEAERLERLERLRAEAIVEPAPTPPPSPTVEADIAAIPDFVLDEAFLWSAEVLASQGRRPDQISIEEITWLNRLRQGLDKTRRNLVNQLRAIVGQGPLNQDAVTEIESLLLQADVGIEATDFIV